MCSLKISSGIISLDDERSDNIWNLLGRILPSWFDSAKFNGRGIKLFLLENYRVVNPRNFKRHLEYPPFLVIRPDRERLDDNEMPGYKTIVSLPSSVKLPDLVREIKNILADKDQMKKFREVMDCVSNPLDGVDQGGACWPILGVAFDIFYYDAHLSIFQGRYYTPG